MSVYQIRQGWPLPLVVALLLLIDPYALGQIHKDAGFLVFTVIFIYMDFNSRTESNCATDGGVAR